MESSAAGFCQNGRTSQCLAGMSPPRSSMRHATRRSPDHPHERGDDVTLAMLSAPIDGSPPRAWGRRPRGDVRPRPERITPTSVGTTPWCPRPPCRGPDHPHERGDDVLLGCPDHGVPGSPPRAWGRPLNHPPPGGRHRITPTSVGDDGGKSRTARHTSGSPPRAWGRRPSVGIASSGFRITPTSVGTTTLVCRRTNAPPDHPHERGDDPARFRFAADSTGSPPRAWGRQPGQPELGCPVRITPTSVGTTKAT